MPWKTISLADVLAYTRDARIEAAFDADSDAESNGWFAIQRDSIVAQIRVKCAAQGANVLDADSATVPPEYQELAILRLLSAILSRTGPTSSGTADDGDPFKLTSDQRSRLDRLEKDLESVSQGKLGITSTTNPEGSHSVGGTGAAAALVTASPRLATRDTLAGL